MLSPSSKPHASPPFFCLFMGNLTLCTPPLTSSWKRAFVSLTEFLIAEELRVQDQNSSSAKFQANINDTHTLAFPPLMLFKSLSNAIQKKKWFTSAESFLPGKLQVGPFNQK